MRTHVAATASVLLLALLPVYADSAIGPVAAERPTAGVGGSGIVAPGRADLAPQPALVAAAPINETVPAAAPTDALVGALSSCS